MARKPRFVLPGVPQHVIQRGNNREPCFYSDEDNVRYLEDLHDAAIKNNAVIHAYVLMTNHVHLLVTPAQSYSIAHMMQDLGRKYVRYINHIYQRTGTFFPRLRMPLLRYRRDSPLEFGSLVIPRIVLPPRKARKVRSRGPLPILHFLLFVYFISYLI